MMNVENIRDIFADARKNDAYVIDKSGCKMLEIIGASFVADEDHIFGAPSVDYIKRELEWYNSQSLNVEDIPGDTPKIWQEVADRNGRINSNYGWCVFSGENRFQYQACLRALKDKRDTRQAIMIYNRPSMHIDAFENDRHDFMCTNAVSYFIRDNHLIAVVQMRSNDAWAGYRNDVAWQVALQHQLIADYNAWADEENRIQPGPIVWNASTLHLYERNFGLIDRYIETGESK